MKIRVRKIRVMDFMNALSEIYDSGAEYVDVIGVSDEIQDTLIFEVRDDIQNDDITDELLNDLI